MLTSCVRSRQLLVIGSSFSASCLSLSTWAGLVLGDLTRMCHFVALVGVVGMWLFCEAASTKGWRKELPLQKRVSCWAQALRWQDSGEGGGRGGSGEGVANCLIQVQCAGQCWAGSLAFELEDLLLLLSGAGSARRSVSCLGTPPLIDMIIIMPEILVTK